MFSIKLLKYLYKIDTNILAYFLLALMLVLIFLILLVIIYKLPLILKLILIMSVFTGSMVYGMCYLLDWLKD